MEGGVSKFHNIPIHIEPSATPDAPQAGKVQGGLGGGVTAILSQVVNLLDALARGNGSALIDLRSLPMSPQDRLDLQQVLGEGEVTATVEADGQTRIRETGIAGVWWVEHFGQHKALIAEMIEVALVPQLLASAVDEIAAAALALRARVAISRVPSLGGPHVALQ
jgi:hydrogenase-1 operon protein HyaF